MGFIRDIPYYVLKGFLHVAAFMPFWILYGIADIIFVLMYFVIRYRRKMVRKNLAECFPTKNERDRRIIERKFYRNFADYIIETIKLMHVSDRTIKRRFKFENVEVLRRLMDERRGTVAYFSHCFNWEWCPSVTLHCPEQLAAGALMCQIYRPLRNEKFDSLMLQLRSRFHSVSIPKKVALRRLLQYKRDGIPTVTGFMSDQKPSHGDAVHIVDFLNRRTAVITGTETLARRLGMAVVYFDMHKLGRGRYMIDVRLMSENGADTSEYYLTDNYIQLLQETIERNPAIWLWSHNRWKNTIPDGK